MRSHRPDKMASLIRTIISDVIAHKLSDPRISPFVSITRVEVTADLQHARVHVSVMGDEAEARSTMRGLEHARGVMQRAVARNVTSRVCPHISFALDGSIKKAAEIIKIIDESVRRPLDEDGIPILDSEKVGEDVEADPVADASPRTTPEQDPDANSRNASS